MKDKTTIGIAQGGEDISLYAAELVAIIEQERHDFEVYISKVISTLHSTRTEEEIALFESTTQLVGLTLEEFIRFLADDNQYYQSMPIVVFLSEVERILMVMKE